MKQTPRPFDPNLPRNLSGVQFRYFPPKTAFPGHSLYALNKMNGKNQMVGFITWHPKTGSVEYVRTHENYRGLGVASTLWERASKLSADTGIRAPKHSRHRTEEGDVWAKSVGGELPKRAD